MLLDDEVLPAKMHILFHIQKNEFESHYFVFQ